MSTVNPTLQARIERIFTKVVADAKAVGVPHGPVASVKVCHRRNEVGVCKARRDGLFEIAFSEVFAELDDRDVADTLMHELIHTCPGAFNHGPVFKRWMHRVNLHGYRVTVAEYSKAAQAMRSADIAASGDEVILVCDCGCRFVKSRRTKVAQHPGNYLCRRHRRPLALAQ